MKFKMIECENLIWFWVFEDERSLKQLEDFSRKARIFREKLVFNEKI